MVSMPSIHFFRWTEQLKNSDFDVYWLNITDSGEYVKRIDWVQQKYAWKLKWDFPGRIRLKKYFPRLSKFIERLNTNSTEKVFEAYLKEVNPDIVHSFALHISCTPILNVMSKLSLKWIFSSWGSDLYARKIELNTTKLKPVLTRIDYLITDCKRDYAIAKEFGFKSNYLGVFPGGGGFITSSVDLNEKEKIVLVKGYDNKHGKCILILEILKNIPLINEYNIIVFGATNNVIEYVEMNKNCFHSIDAYKTISYNNLQELFKKSEFYIGFSYSDGTPNTMLEALIAGCVVLQTNPGGVTEEWINDKVNGFILPYDLEKLKKKVEYAICKKINNQNLLNNVSFFSNLLNRRVISKKTIDLYENI